MKEIKHHVKNKIVRALVKDPFNKLQNKGTCL